MRYEQVAFFHSVSRPNIPPTSQEKQTELMTQSERLKAELQTLQDVEYEHQEKKKHYDAVMMGTEAYVVSKQS